MKRRDFTITEQLDQRLIEEARVTGLSMSDIIRRAIGEYLEKQQERRDSARGAAGWPRSQQE